jgi:hypothetical protein
MRENGKSSQQTNQKGDTKMVRLKAIALFVILTLVLSVPTGCASTGGGTAGDVLQQFAGTLEQVCHFWRVVKPYYPQARTLAIELHDAGKIDAELWQAFVYIDQNAGKLDRWLALVCERNAGASNEAVIAKEKSGVDWNAVGENVLKVAVFAVQSGLLK